jgi:hypothetical protein
MHTALKCKCRWAGFFDTAGNARTASQPQCHVNAWYVDPWEPVRLALPGPGTKAHLLVREEAQDGVVWQGRVPHNRKIALHQDGPVFEVRVN